MPYKQLIHTWSILTAIVAVVSLTLAGCYSPSGLTDGETSALREIINNRSEQARGRDPYRHPQQTVTFFGLKPGMTVLEVLPGGGWYTEILAPYLGQQGTLHAANYADSMWPLFGYMSEEFVAQRKQQMRDWPQQLEKLGGNAEKGRGFTLASIPAELKESFDAVLFIRALHNLARFERDAKTLSQAVQASYAALKPGGIVGIVQHRANESSDPAWAQGQNGYLKQSMVIQVFQNAGFELVATSEINANPDDQPSINDKVWRLPPSLRVANATEQQLAANRAIGESDRMTLLFRKPVSY